MERRKRARHMRIVMVITLIVLAAPSHTSAAQDSDFPPFEVIRTWSATTPGVVKNRVEPTWPRVDGKVMGAVFVDVWIDEAGRVRDARITRSIPIIDAAVLVAVRQWTFTPATVGGRPVAVVQQVEVRYPPSPQ